MSSCRATNGKPTTREEVRAEAMANVAARLSPPPAQPVGEDDGARRCGVIPRDPPVQACVLHHGHAGPHRRFDMSPFADRTYTQAEVDAEIAAVVERCAAVLGDDHLCVPLVARIRSLSTAPQRAALSALLAAERERGREEGLPDAVLASASIAVHTCEIPGVWVSRFTDDANVVTQGSSRTDALVCLLDAARMMVRHCQKHHDLAAARQEGAEREREEIADVLHTYLARCTGTAEKAEIALTVLEAKVRARGGK